MAGNMRVCKGGMCKLVKHKTSTKRKKKTKTKKSKPRVPKRMREAIHKMGPRFNPGSPKPKQSAKTLTIGARRKGRDGFMWKVVRRGQTKQWVIAL